MTQAATAAVRKQIVVDAPQDRAFTVFTENFGDFKPREHNIMRSPIARTVFEPRVGGHIVESARDGSTCTWGTVTAWEPGVRFACTWHPGLSPDEATDLEVAFAAAPGGCEVVLVHSGWERRAGGAEMRARYGVGWDFVLDKYTASLH